MKTPLKNAFGLNGFGTALQTLTAIPWPAREPADFAASLPWFPIIGLLVGGILYGINLSLAIFPLPPWPIGTALLLLAADICLTRGLHLDGVADWADSLGAIQGREKRLAIMKDSAVGAFGVMAIVVTVLLKWMAFERLISCGTALWIIPVFILSRDRMVALITTLPYARAGEGMGRPFVVQASFRKRVLSHAATLLLGVFFGPFFGILFFLGWVETRLFGRRCRNVFGGITGDLLGTANEMVEITLLMFCAFFGETLNLYTGWGWV